MSITDEIESSRVVDSLSASIQKEIWANNESDLALIASILDDGEASN